MTDLKQVVIYTDGACSGNPGPGGYGAVLLYNGHRKELSGGFRLTNWSGRTATPRALARARLGASAAPSSTREAVPIPEMRDVAGKRACVVG